MTIWPACQDVLPPEAYGLELEQEQFGVSLDETSSKPTKSRSFICCAVGNSIAQATLWADLSGILIGTTTVIMLSLLK